MASFKLQSLWSFQLLFVLMTRLMSSFHGISPSNGVCLSGGRCKFRFPFHISPRSSAQEREFLYQVVIDAGSTGSRAHIFTFRRTLAGLILKNADYAEIEPGLSYYLNKPEEGVYSVNGLLQQALKVVPQYKWESTSISLRATAGLRLLPQLVAADIMNKVREVLMSSPFRTFNTDFISIMDGDDEGVFAWTTLNFLTENLNKPSPSTLGALDLGGGSTQIVFRPASQDTVLSSPKSHLNTVKILGAHYDLYCYSYLGLGLMSARQAVFQLTNAAGNENAHSVSVSPCIFRTYRGVWSFSGKETAIHGNNSFSYETCLHYVKQIVTDVHRPAEIANRDFYAFSYYYDTAVGLGLVAPNVGGALSLGSYLSAAKKVCSDEGKELLDSSPFLCLDAVYITTLLKNGYGFQETQIFQVVKKINNVEMSWALGAALHMLGDF